jgi:HK97 gp10 family phage protein
MLTLQGDADLRKRFQALKGKGGKAAMRKGTRAGAKMMGRAIEQTAPRGKTGRLGKVKVRAMKRSRTRVGTSASVTADYAGVTELGGHREAAQHFVQRAARQAGPAALRRSTEVMRDEIELQAARR